MTTRQTQYRVLLPVIQTIAAVLFGGVGLWQRHAILNQRFIGDQTMWDTTARFHVWPLPYRFAVIREMLEHYSHIRQEAKRKAVAELDNVTITSQLSRWKAEAEERERAKKCRKTKKIRMVGPRGRS